MTKPDTLDSQINALRITRSFQEAEALGASIAEHGDRGFWALLNLLLSHDQREVARALTALEATGQVGTSEAAKAMEAMLLERIETAIPPMILPYLVEHERRGRAESGVAIKTYAARGSREQADVETAYRQCGAAAWLNPNDD